MNLGDRERRPATRGSGRFGGRGHRIFRLTRRVTPVTEHRGGRCIRPSAGSSQSHKNVGERKVDTTHLRPTPTILTRQTSNDVVGPLKPEPGVGEIAGEKSGDESDRLGRATGDKLDPVHSRSDDDGCHCGRMVRLVAHHQTGPGGKGGGSQGTNAHFDVEVIRSETCVAEESLIPAFADSDPLGLDLDDPIGNGGGA